MKYMRTWSIPPQNIPAIKKRFGEWVKAGAPTPGIKSSGRWHCMVGEGFELLETDDHAALMKYLSQWSDLCKQQVVPVVDDKEAFRLLGD